MTELATLALEIAAAEDGQKEDPPKSNRGKRIDLYQRHMGIDVVRQARPWCSCFVCWSVDMAAERLGMKPVLRGSAKCLRLVELNQALLLERPEPGCIFVNLEPDTHGHTGFVVDVMADHLVTREGNSNKAGSRTGGEVLLGTRPLDYAECYLAIR